MPIGSFEQKYVIIRGVLHPEQMKQHMFTILVDQSVSYSDLYEHICLENINKL